MGNKKNKQLTALLLLLIVAGLLVYRPSNSVTAHKPSRLQEVLGPVQGYRLLESTPVSDDIATFLKLDDYTQNRYESPSGPVSLYVGYYYSLAKVSAAHSPLVCFPGQGWQISEPKEFRLQVGDNVIHYAEIEAGLDGHKELVLYWYQAHDKTAPKVYQNKLLAVLNKLSGNKEEHAFVRVTVPMTSRSTNEARAAGKEFIKAFYPQFLDYIESGVPVADTGNSEERKKG